MCRIPSCLFVKDYVEIDDMRHELYIVILMILENKVYAYTTVCPSSC